MSQSFDINVREEARTRWLKPSEVYYILQNHERFPITHEAPKKPPSGSLFLYNRRVNRYFRRDGHTWRRKKDGRTVGEAHERLKVGNVDSLSCYYAHGEQNPCFQRRCFWMLEPAYEHIVLVQYREVAEGRYYSSQLSNGPPEPLSSLGYPNAICGNQYHSSTSGICEGSESHQSYSNLSSVTEVSSYSGNKEYNKNDGGLLSIPEVGHTCLQQNQTDKGNSKNKSGLNMALKKIAEQLSLGEDDDDDYIISKQAHSVGGDNQVKQIRQEGTQKGLSRNIAPSWEDVLHSSSGLPTSSIYQQSDVEYQKNSEYHLPECLDSSDLRIQLSAAKRFLLGPEATIDSPSLNSVLRNRVNSVTDTISAYDSRFECSLNPDWQTKTALTFQNNSQGSEMTELFDHGHFEPYSREDTTFALGQTNKFNIREISPEWAFSYEITKVIITGDFLCDPSNLCWAVMFGDSEVPVEIVQPGVLRCHTPLHSSGNLRIAITSGNREVCSEFKDFEFRSKPTSSSFTDIAPSSSHLKSSEELLLVAKFARMLNSEVPGLMVSRKRDREGETPLSKNMTEDPPSSTYMEVMAWFAMGKLRQQGRPSHICMQQVGQELLGRDDIRQKVMEKILLDSNGVNNCTVISIYGWSGFGKTSLLHVLYNDQQLLDAFDKRIWLQISEKVDIAMFFRKIIEFAMNERCSIKNIDILRELVMEEITDKKFLLFLDDADIENQQFWTTVLEVLNTGAKGSVAVMATKSSIVADVINVATHSYSLNPLSEENNLMLLQQYAVVGSDIHSNSDLAMMANRIISRFGSHLLHLKAICGLLCHTDAFSVGKDKFEGSVIMPLRLCHDILPVHLKRCLALCSLFPEGYIFDKHHMVLLWISHGCVRPVEGYELEDVGVEYFNELLCRSFFQCSPVHSDKDSMFVMHELMYNVVASVSRDKYFKSEDPMCSIPENVLHCSLISSQFQTVELMHRTEQLKDLQTFLALQPEWKPNNISLPNLNLVGLDDFFLKFTFLETLDLSHTETEELPASIAGLRNLRYLSVNCTNVRALPSELYSLSNLQTLEAKHCRFLTELPRDIKMLVKLRHLDLTKELGYVHLPRGIGELTELQTLPVFHVSEDSSHCSISELGNLQSLRGCLWLSGLGSVKTGNKAQEANLKDKNRLKDLTLQWHDEDEDEGEDEDEDAQNVADEQVLEGLEPHVNLQVLAIRGYEGSRFPAWMQGSSSLPNLVILTLDCCCSCTEFPAIAHLPSLKSLSVRKMYDVQRLSSNTQQTQGNGAAKFPSLELLNLWEMYGLEELFFEESEGDCPRLRKICISRCPDLKRLPRARSLTELVLHCGQQVPDISKLASLVSLKIEGFHCVRSFGLPAAAALKKLEIRSCRELSSVDGLSAALTTVRRLKIAGCPKLVLPERQKPVA